MLSLAGGKCRTHSCERKQWNRSPAEILLMHKLFQIFPRTSHTIRFLPTFTQSYTEDMAGAAESRPNRHRNGMQEKAKQSSTPVSCLSWCKRKVTDASRQNPPVCSTCQQRSGPKSASSPYNTTRRSSSTLTMEASRTCLAIHVPAMLLIESRTKYASLQSRAPARRFARRH